MIVHVVSTRPKTALVKWARLEGMIDRWIVYCTAQADFAERELKVKPKNIIVTPFMVDTEFFSPEAPESEGVGIVDEQSADGPCEGSRPMICAVGLERRDYPTLMEAVDGLDVDVVVAAASPWSTQASFTEGVGIPDNVSVESFSQLELRGVYRRSAFSVMPLVEVDFQAGITAILESMSMARTVVCTRTAGQTDTIIGPAEAASSGASHATGCYVASGDARALRTAISDLLDRPQFADELGGAARSWAVQHADIEVYARRLGEVVLGLGGERAAEVNEPAAPNHT